MAADAARRRASYQDVLDAPASVVAEVVAGTLYTHPRPSSAHAHAASVLNMDLGSAFHRGRSGPGGWIVLVEPELHLGEDIVVPDLGAWRRERMPEVPDVAYFELAPDWVGEVASTSTALHDRRHKLPVYAGAGVAHVWLVDPRARFVEVLRLDDDAYRLVNTHGGDETARLEPFEEVELELGALWIGSTPTE